MDIFFSVNQQGFQIFNIAINSDVTRHLHKHIITFRFNVNVFHYYYHGQIKRFNRKVLKEKRGQLVKKTHYIHFGKSLFMDTIMLYKFMCSIIKDLVSKWEEIINSFSLKVIKQDWLWIAFIQNVYFQVTWCNPSQNPLTCLFIQRFQCSLFLSKWV